MMYSQELWEKVYLETVEQFQQRRILYTIKEYRRKGEELEPWKILRSAGIQYLDYGTV
jgi:hypothetical protein